MKDLLASKGGYLRAHPIDALRSSPSLEAMTRVATYANARSGVRRRTPPRWQAGKQRSTSPASARHARANMIAAFFNADIQHRQIHPGPQGGGLGGALTRSPAQAVLEGDGARGLGLITLPTLLLYLVNRNDARWRGGPRWMKDRFWYSRWPTTRCPSCWCRSRSCMASTSMAERIFRWADTRTPPPSMISGPHRQCHPDPEAHGAFRWSSGGRIKTSMPARTSNRPTQRWDAQFARGQIPQCSPELSDTANKPASRPPGQMQNAIIGIPLVLDASGLRSPTS